MPLTLGLESTWRTQTFVVARIGRSPLPGDDAGVRLSRARRARRALAPRQLVDARDAYGASSASPTISSRRSACADEELRHGDVVFG